MRSECQSMVTDARFTVQRRLGKGTIAEPPLAFNCNIANCSHVNPNISVCMELPVDATAFSPLVCSKRCAALYLHRVDGFYSRSLFVWQ